MFKKIRKLLVVAFCITFLFGMTAEAEGNTEFHVENQTGKAGDIVTVPVQFNTGQEVGGFQISIYYDSDVMEFQNLEKGNLILENDSSIFDYNHIEESSEIVVVYVVADTVKDEGVIVNINFKLKQDCGEDLPIGMGVDQMVDGSEENNALTGTVSGVDTVFQEKVMEQRTDDTSTVVASGDSSDGASSGSSSGNSISNSSDGQTDGNGTADAEDSNNTAGQEDQTVDAEVSGTTDDENVDSGIIAPIIIGVIVVVVIVAVVLIVVLKKESRYGRRGRRK